MATSGTISASLQLFFMPHLLRRFDHAKMYNTCIAIFPYCFILLPSLNIIAQWGAVVGEDGTVGVTPGTKALLWVGIGCLLTMARTACLAFS